MAAYKGWYKGNCVPIVDLEPDERFPYITVGFIAVVALVGSIKYLVDRCKQKRKKDKRSRTRNKADTETLIVRK